MKPDHFPYIYSNGHWVRDTEPEPTWRDVLELVLSMLAMGVCLVAVMMLWLCG